MLKDEQARRPAPQLSGDPWTPSDVVLWVAGTMAGHDRKVSTLRYYSVYGIYTHVISQSNARRREAPVWQTSHAWKKVPFQPLTPGGFGLTRPPYPFCFKGGGSVNTLRHPGQRSAKPARSLPMLRARAGFGRAQPSRPAPDGSVGAVRGAFFAMVRSSETQTSTGTHIEDGRQRPLFRFRQKPTWQSHPAM